MPNNGVKFPAIVLLLAAVSLVPAPALAQRETEYERQTFRPVVKSKPKQQQHGQTISNSFRKKLVEHGHREPAGYRK